MKNLNYPKEVPISRYFEVLESVVEKLGGIPGVIAIYQAGSVRTPGISDIDLIVVFQDSARARWLPSFLSGIDDSYLFVHAPFGVHLCDFRSALRFGVFNNLKLLKGRDVGAESEDIFSNTNAALRAQLAMEYLLRMFMSMTIEGRMGHIDVRNFLLNGAALRFDLELLGMQSGVLSDTVKMVEDWRVHWFKMQLSRELLLDGVANLRAALERLLTQELPRALSLPSDGPHRLGKRVWLAYSDRLAVETKGFLFPAGPFVGIKAVRRLRMRAMRFYFFVPFTCPPHSPEISSYLDFKRQLTKKCSVQLEGFMPLTSSLNLC